MVITIHGKGDLHRQVPITDTAAEWLKNYLNHKERKEGKGWYQGDGRICKKGLSELGCQPRCQMLPRMHLLFDPHNAESA